MFLFVKLKGIKQRFISSGCDSWCRTDDLKDSPVFTLVQRCNSHSDSPPTFLQRQEEGIKIVLCFLYFGLNPFGQPIKHPTLPTSLSRKSFPAKSCPACKVWHQLLEPALLHTPLLLSLGSAALMVPFKENWLWQLYLKAFAANKNTTMAFGDL